jgi:LEA14-like dessication related protein
MKTSLLYFFLLISISSCTINKQIKEIKTLAKCEFEVYSLNNLDIAGTDVIKIIQTGEINLMSMPSLALGLLNRNVPLNVNFTLGIKNPTSDMAAINEFDYQLFINQQELVEGKMDQQIEIPAGENTLVPLEFSFNIYKFLSNDSIRNDIQEFIRASENSELKDAQLTIKIRPSVLIGNTLIKYPNFITIEKTLNNKFLLNQ